MIMLNKARFIRICYLLDMARKSISFDLDGCGAVYVDYSKALDFVKVLEKQLKEEVRGVRDSKKQKKEV